MLILDFKLFSLTSLTKTPDKEYIFNRFYTADKNRSYSSLGGTGLGLSIVKHAANLHSGKVELIDTTKGATFRVTIPQIN